ncbi:DUF2065 domain-containing protein [Pleionea sediminis]|uniref:DUF2065 domain-containing protein n=1 Tax=Pleionea sediminis TaxID=2569479 RepID=UPI0011864BC6|nr:DUF2065 domain-containing protein [Pleionea sediminis]
MTELWIALALVLVIEGILPFANPKAWRNFVLSMAEQSDKSLRIIGFIFMIGGLFWLTLLKSG